MRFNTLLCIIAMLTMGVAYGNGGFTVKTVVIDAGHGGKDPGAIGPGKTNEKDVTLQVALKLGEAIKKAYPDVNVIYTRKTDVFVELYERADIANKAKADLFIAIHCNSNTNSQSYGSSSYVLGLHKTEANLEVAKRENAVILLEDNRDKNYEFDPNTPEGHIIMSMKQNAFLDQSIGFASKVESHIEENAKRKSLGVKQAGFYVLYKTTMPSVLCEIGFVSNPDEEKYLASTKGQDQISNALLRAFVDYKLELEQSEGDQFAYEQSVEQAKTDTSSTANVTPPPSAISATTDTKTTSDINSTATKDNKTTTDNKQPAKTEDKQPAKDDPTYVALPDGGKIKRPIEGPGGGGATPKAVTKEEQPVASKTTSESKTTTREDEPVTTSKTNAKSSTTENKTSEPAPTKTTTTESKSATREEQPVGSKTTTTKSSSTESKTSEPAPAKSTTENKPTTKTEQPVTTKTTTTKSPSTESKTSEASTTGGGVTYKVQFIALKGDLKGRDKAEKLLSGISTETLSNGIIRYYGGNVKTLAEARKIQQTAISNGYAGAFVVKFKDGVRIEKVAD